MLKAVSRVFFSFFPPLLVAVVGSGVVDDNLSWYRELNVPSVNVEPAIIGIVWSILYILMGMGCFMILGTKSKLSKSNAYVTYLIQLVFNLSWTFMFFGLRDIALGFVVSVLLVIAVFINLVRFYQIRRRSAMFLIPYLAWSIFACYLNYRFVLVN